MTERDRPQQHVETEAIPTVEGRDPTLEMPAVETAAVPPPAPAPPAEPAALAEPPAADEATAPAQPVSPAPAQPVAAQPVAAQPVPPPAPAQPVAAPPVPPSAPAQPGVAPPVQQPSAGPPPGNGLRNTLVGLLVIGLLAIAGLLAWQRLGTGTETPATPQAAGSKPLPDAKVSSFDPSGGSGFRSEGNSTWRTQTYRSATFGNLKPGVGLLLDLGSKQQLSEVTLNAVTDGLTVELRAADDRAGSADGYKQVGKPAQASGATKLKADTGGAHRYWLIWVTELAAVDGGFRAEISKPVARAAG